MKTLILLTGNIASGKSTLAKKWAKAGYRIISRDAIRYMVGAGDYIFNIDLEPTIKKGTLALLEEFLKDGIDIVYDEVNVNKKLREPTIKLAKKYGYKVLAVILPRLSKKESVNRRLKNPHGQPDRKIWEEVWERFDKIYEIPTLEEGINRIIKVK